MKTNTRTHATAVAVMTMMMMWIRPNCDQPNLIRHVFFLSQVVLAYRFHGYFYVYECHWDTFLLWGPMLVPKNSRWRNIAFMSVNGSGHSTFFTHFFSLDMVAKSNHTISTN